MEAHPRGYLLVVNFMPLYRFFQWHDSAAKIAQWKTSGLDYLWHWSIYMKLLIMRNMSLLVFITEHYLRKKDRFNVLSINSVLLWLLVFHAGCLNDDDDKADEMHSRQDCFLPNLLSKGSHLLCWFSVPYGGFDKEKYSNTTGVATEDFIWWTSFFPCVYFNAL